MRLFSWRIGRCAAVKFGLGSALVRRTSPTATTSSHPFQCAGYSANIDTARAPDAAGNIWAWACGQAHKMDAVPLLLMALTPRRIRP